MASLGEYLGGIATGVERAVGTTGQALGNVAKIMQMQQLAEEMRRSKELFPYEVQKRQAEGALAQLQTEQARSLLRPIPLGEQGETKQPAIPQPGVVSSPELSAETAIAAGIQQSQAQEMSKPIPVKDIEVSGIVPSTTIQTILKDPFLSSIAVDYDQNGRPYTNLVRLQTLDKVLSSTQAIESGLTEKVTKATIQGLLAEEDKILGDLAKLQQDPTRNKNKIDALQQNLAMIRQRIQTANQHLLLSDLKLYKEYMMNIDKLDQQRQLKLAQLETQLQQQLGAAQLKAIQAQIAQEKADLTWQKLQVDIDRHGGVHKVEKMLATLKNGQQVPVERIYYKDGFTQLMGPFGEINTAQIEKLEWATKPDILSGLIPPEVQQKVQERIKEGLGATKPKEKESKGSFEVGPDGSLIFRK